MGKERFKYYSFHRHHGHWKQSRLLF